MFVNLQIACNEPSREWAFEMISLSPLMLRTVGDPRVVVGLIDGPIAGDYSAIDVKRVAYAPSKFMMCTQSEPSTSVHGTLVASIMFADRGSATPGICPGCSLVVRPIFGDCNNNAGKIKATVLDLADAISDCLEFGTHVINISATIVSSDAIADAKLRKILDLAEERGVLIVAATGNAGTIVTTALLSHRWVIPVVAYNRIGELLRSSNVGLSIGKHGVGAPGDDIPAIHPDGRRVLLKGTSIATPFVTGSTALLLSEFPRIKSRAIHAAMRRSAGVKRSCVYPSVLNISSAVATIS